MLSIVSVSLARAILWQPALIRQRTDKLARVPFRYAVTASLSASLLVPAAAVFVSHEEVWKLAIVFAANVFSVGFDWARFRCLSIDRRWSVAIADIIRFILVLLVGLIAQTQDGLLFQALLAFSCILPLLFLTIRMGRIDVWTPYGIYKRDALLQGVDYGVSQINTTLPILIIGALSVSGIVGGFRVAQTILGPLNLVFASASSTVIANAANDERYSSRKLAATGTRLAWRLTAFSSAVVLGVFFVVAYLTPPLSGVNASELAVACVAVGFVAVASSGAGIQGVVLRLLGHNRLVTKARMFVVLSSWIGFIVGYYFGGAAWSLVAGFTLSAAAFPLAYLLPARRIFSGLG
ncbi:hypothetical protein [Paenarthrobacter sp. C1]|uniref:hypothetical protein n=1 Tax=Paenarthrobacter sp. C1 TaxID=3400220 RepID=UPI003BF46E42